MSGGRTDLRSRHCAGCGHSASESARFCERCGSALTLTAAALRAPGALEARILEERRSIEGERKQVTVMYADIVGSMELTQALEAERWGLVLDRFLALAAGAVHAFEGTVNQFTGDGLLAVFGAPLAHEDHARRACLAVLELQRVVAGLASDVARRDGADFAIRCGLNSGEVLVGAIGDDVHMDFVPLGNTTALGKRIESLAPAGSIAISASTAALVEGEFELRDHGEFEVKGSDEPQRMWELVGLGAAQTRLAAVAATRGLSLFVGRMAEQAKLEAALEAALSGHGRAIGLVGDAGVGKSRLVHEFVARCAARGLPVTSTAAVAHGRYVPLVPILALYRDYFGIGAGDSPEAARERIESAMRAIDPASTDDLPLLFEFLGVPDPHRPLDDIDAAERRQRLLGLLERTTRTSSDQTAAVIVVEDLHWLDDASAAFLDALISAAAGTRTLVICTYRPEYEAKWAGTGDNAEIALGPLTAEETGDLLAQLLGSDPALAALEKTISARTAGNPFFAEEIVQALAENGRLVGVSGSYRLASDLDVLVLPVTVQAGLAARIDRLGPREKELVQTMSVIGHEIPGPLLSELSDLSAEQMDEAIDILTRSQWILPRDTAEGSRAWTFKHPLTQEVAYASQLSKPRVAAHRAVADAITRAYPQSLDERAALLAHHYDTAGEDLAAARWHARAATWAEHTATAESARHWRRVSDLAAGLDGSAEGEQLAAAANIGLLSMGWRMGITPGGTATPDTLATNDDERFLVDLYSAGTLLHSGREREGLAGFKAANRRSLDEGHAGRALLSATGVQYASWIAGSLHDGLAAIDEALAMPGVDRYTGTGIAFVCPYAKAFGDRGQCVGYLGDLDAARRDFALSVELAREAEDPETESAGYGNLALLEAESGEFEAAIANAGLGLAIAERMGNVVHELACSTPVAVAHAGLGRFEEGLAQAEANLATIRQQSIALYYEPLLLATIARCRLGLGRPAEARAAAEEAVAVKQARGLTTVAAIAPVVLAEIVSAVEKIAPR